MISSSEVPEDILILILNRLPLKSLHRFNAVSKSWSLLIQNLFLGFFYRISSYESPYPADNFTFDHIFTATKLGIHTSAIDPPLSFPFIPYNLVHDLAVRDCCNGLLLFRFTPNIFRCVPLSDPSSYVCNPFTKSWTRFSTDDANCAISLLDFDPRVSPHFKVVSFTQIQQTQIRIRVLSSKTPRMRWTEYAPVSFRDPPSSSSHHGSFMLMTHHNHHALWEGSLYSLLSSDWMNFGDGGRIMRFGSFREEGDGGVRCQLIQLPAGTKNSTRASIWRLRDKLCLAGIDRVTNVQQQARLRVWSLSTRDQIVWELEHESIMSTNLLCLDDGTELPYIGGFHPLLDVVFILRKGAVYAYDLKKLSLYEVCRIGPRGSLATSASIFPFLPTSAEYRIEWRTNRNQA